MKYLKNYNIFERNEMPKLAYAKLYWDKLERYIKDNIKNVSKTFAHNLNNRENDEISIKIKNHL